jgi:hypothetical protein
MLPSVMGNEDGSSSVSDVPPDVTIKKTDSVFNLLPVLTWRGHIQTYLDRALFR